MGVDRHTWLESGRRCPVCGDDDSIELNGLYGINELDDPIEIDKVCSYNDQYDSSTVFIHPTTKMWERKFEEHTETRDNGKEYELWRQVAPFEDEASYVDTYETLEEAELEQSRRAYNADLSTSDYEIRIVDER